MRLIDADELYEFLREKTEYESAAEQMMADLKNEHTRRMLDRFATVDAEPVRHGAWIDPEENDGHTEWHCSYCGDVVCTTCGYPGANYCSFCGTKMDGGEKNEDISIT